MSSAVLSRVARASLAGAQACRVRPVRALPAVHFRPAVSAFSTAGRKLADVDAHDPHHEESFEEFTARYAKRKTRRTRDMVLPGLHNNQRKLPQTCRSPSERSHTQQDTTNG